MLGERMNCFDAIYFSTRLGRVAFGDGYAIRMRTLDTMFRRGDTGLGHLGSAAFDGLTFGGESVWVEDNSQETATDNVGTGDIYTAEVTINAGNGGRFVWIDGAPMANPLRLRSPEPLRPQGHLQQTQGLSTCVKNLLGSFFQEAGVLFPRFMNLDAIRIHNGLPEIVEQLAVIDVGAITIANDIFAAPDQFNRFAGRTWDDLRLVAHELVHVKQYAQLRKIAGMGSEAMGAVGGTIAFGSAYTAGYLAGLLQGKSDQQAEHDNPYEKRRGTGHSRL